jgi:hypothetical protein
MGNKMSFKPINPNEPENMIKPINPYEPQPDILSEIKVGRKGKVGKNIVWIMEKGFRYYNFLNIDMNELGWEKRYDDVLESDYWFTESSKRAEASAFLLAAIFKQWNEGPSEIEPLTINRNYIGFIITNGYPDEGFWSGNDLDELKARMESFGDLDMGAIYGGDGLLVTYLTNGAWWPPK